VPITDTEPPSKPGGYRGKSSSSKPSPGPLSQGFPVEVHRDDGTRELIRAAKVKLKDGRTLHAGVGEDEGRWFDHRPVGLGLVEIDPPDASLLPGDAGEGQLTAWFSTED
jgi:hypothetical protein